MTASAPGPSATWGSLIVHLVFGLVVALVSRRLARGRRTPVQMLTTAAKEA